MNVATIIDGHPGDAAALVTAGGVTTYAGLQTHAAAWRGGFARLGVGPGDRVAIVSANDSAFVAAYLEPDPEEGGYRTKAVPCPFLGEDDRCTIYAVRPQACRGFPHTDKEGFIWRTSLHTANTLSCPAVYFIVKRLRQRLRR